MTDSTSRHRTPVPEDSTSLGSRESVGSHESDISTDGDLHREAAPMDSAADRKPGWIGAFRILEVLGEGGMGIVFLAEQTAPIERRVALKVIRESLRHSKVRARFDAERQALARLSHPGIGQVFEAGDTPEGSPYFAMELIAGPRLSEYCDRHRLTVEERLVLFQRVCHAIHHVHQKGVLHRDLKDENILVAVPDGSVAPADAQPKIIDFGIARALDQDSDDRLTRVGAFVGTPAYLSPELLMGVGGDDLRVDVYALGVLLYNLLVGELPFEQGTSSVMTLLARIRDEDAVRPSDLVARLEPSEAAARAAARHLRPATLSRHLRGDLDAIVGKAMAKHPDDRYGSAAELAADIDRFLSSEPIRAQPTSAWVRGYKFARRYRGGVLAVMAVLVVLMGGLWARSLEATRANHEAAVAREVSDFLVELFKVADPGRSLGDQVTARELLDRGAERIHLELAQQPLTRARLLDTIGVVYEQLGVLQPAEEHLRESLKLRRAGLDDHAPEVLTSLNHLGKTLWSQGRFAEAEPLLREAVDGWRRLADKPQLGHALGLLGMLYEVQGDFENAEAPLREALSIFQSLDLPMGLAAAYDDLGVFESDRGRGEAAERLFRQALELREAALGALHPDVATSLNGLAITLAESGRMAEAEPLFRRALEIRRKVLGDLHPQLAQSLNNLASCLRALGRAAEALPLYDGALAIWEQTLGRENIRLARGLANVAELHASLSQVEDAEQRYRESIEVFDAYHAREEQARTSIEGGLGEPLAHTQMASVLLDLADLLREQERRSEALPLYRRAFELRLHDLGPEDDLTVQARNALRTAELSPP